ncbi:hypothetical protein ACERNI_15335 [Camelimonas sp. ID_303_24]
MATATFANVSANHNARSGKHAGFGAALRSLFTGFRYGVSGDVLHTAAQLGPEQLKEVGGVQDSETGLVYATR